MVVALVLDNARQENIPVAIILLAKGELNEVRVSFLNRYFILLCTSYFLAIFPIFDFDSNTYNDESLLIKVLLGELLDASFDESIDKLVDKSEVIIISSLAT